MNKFIGKYYKLWVGSIILLAFFIRFFQLGNVPNGLYQDETALGYNAYSILETGRDEHGIKYPFYFKSFGDYKLPVYFYITSFSIKTFGLNEFAVRFPSAIMGVIGVLLIILIVKKVVGKNSIALISGYFLTITPWHIHFSRAAFEVNIALTFTLFGVLMFLYALNSKREIIFLTLSTIGFVLAMYSYNVTRLLVPLIILSLLFIYRKEIRNIKKSSIAVTAFITFILLTPFILTFFTRGGAQSASGALITSKDILARIAEQRSYMLMNNYPDIITKLLFNKYIMTLGVYFENLVSVMNPAFLFVRGSTHGNQGVGNFGPLLLIQAPFVFYGLINLIKGNLRNSKLFVLWLFIALLVLGLSKEVPHATRGYFLVIPFTYLTAVGFVNFVSNFRRNNEILNFIILFFTSVLITLNFTYYLSSYFYRFPVEYAKSWRSEDKELVNFLVQNEKDYDKIIIDNKADFIYTSYLFYSAYDPQSFYTSSKRLPDDNEGFSKVLSFGKFEYKDIDWSKDYPKAKTLIITTKNNKPQEIPVFRSFDYPQRPVVLSIKEELFEFPVTDNAYILVN